jgi:hypothetical protein
MKIIGQIHASSVLMPEKNPAVTIKWEASGPHWM